MICKVLGTSGALFYILTYSLHYQALVTFRSGEGRHHAPSECHKQSLRVEKAGGVSLRILSSSVWLVHMGAIGDAAIKKVWGQVDEYLHKSTDSGEPGKVFEQRSVILRAGF